MDPNQSADPQNAGQQFKCPNCSGTMIYDAEVQAMRCTYCRHTAPAATFAPTQGIYQQAPDAPRMAALQANPAAQGQMVPAPREIPLEEGLAKAPKGLGTEVQAVKCQECGATVNLGPTDRTASCTYCASTMVMPVPADPNLITPESLVPFKIPKEKATQSFRGWLSGLWFRPSNLQRMAKLDQIFGVYVPYWTFDANVDSQWTAQRGHYYYETETVTRTDENGKQYTTTEQVQKTRWESAWGSRRDHYDDVLVCGSKGLPEDLGNRFATFDTKTLIPYAPAYLAGWRAESYAVDLRGGWVFAQRKMEAQQFSRCGQDVGGDTHQGLSVQNHFYGQTFKHVLLPVWVAAYRYQDKPFRFLVNGQTGEVVGKAPYSVLKIVLFILTIIAVIVGIYLLVNRNS